MGKAKPTKKPSSPLKISTSLFQKKGKKSAGSSSGTDDDSTSNSPTPSPSPKKSMKAKSSKETKPKTSPKKGKAGQSSSSSGPSTSAAAAKQAKSGTKSKPTEKKSTAASKGKGTEKEKAGVKGKASKQTEKKGSSTASKTSKSTKEKEKPKSKATKTSTLRKRSKSSSTATSSSSASTSSSTSSSSRSPSPAPKKTKTSTKSADSKKPTPVKKKAASGGKSGKESAEKEKDKDKGKGSKSKGKSKPVKVTAAKPKGSAKPAKPKAKLKRMASLNAKAILEASFNSDSPEKKQRSPAVTPTKMTVQKIPQASTSTSTGTSMDIDSDEAEDFKPLTLLFSAPEPEPIIPKPKTVSPGGERKRKSSAVKIPQPNLSQPSAVIDRRDSISASIESSIAKAVSPGFRRTSSSAGTSSSPPVVLDNRCGPSAVPPVKAKKNEKGKSPTPKKKSKVVASSSVSTSTSPMERQEEVAFKAKSSSSQPLMFKSGIPATKIEPTTDRSTFHSPFSVQGQSHHQVQQHSSTHSGKQKSASGQAKEKASKSSAPVAHFGSTVYQPAGPLIEPHKTVMTGSVPVGLLPDSVRIPSDLKVTYQAHPPTTSVLTHSTSSYSTPSHSSKGSSSSTKHASDHKGHAGASTSTGSSSSHSKSKILHQPYKSTSSSSVTIASSTATVRSSTQVEVQQSSFGAHPGNFSIPGSSSTLSTSTTGFLSQQGSGLTIGQSHPSGTLVPSAAGSEPIPAFPTPTASAGVYYGYGTAASHSSPFTPSKYPFGAPDYRPPQHSAYPSSFMYAPGNPQPTPNYFMAPFYSPPITPGAGLAFGGTQSRALLAAHHPGAAAAGATAAAYYQSGPPLAHHPASSYYVAGPSLPSHHSIQPSTAPGHAGPSPPNRSSQTACPSTSCPPNSNSTSNNSSTTSSSNNTNNKANRPLLPKRQPPQPSATNASREVLDLAIKKAKAPTVTANKKRKECSTPALGADPPKTFSKSFDIVQSQAKQLESAKTFTEQYSLPDDITITPIIMSPGSTSASAYYGNGLNTSTTQQRKRDIVHVIDPRSGLTTTIAKHISNNNILVGASPSNVSPVKPNNAGNVGKISPDLDVIVIGRGNPTGAGAAKSQVKKTANRRSSATQGKVGGQIPVFPGAVQPFTSTTKTFNHRMALSSSTAVNNNMGTLMSGPFAPNYQIGGTLPITNLVQPLPQQILARSENTTKQVQGTGVKRKGLSLNECIDGLKMKKKMRILGDTNISIKSAVGSPLMNSTTVLPLNIPSIHMTMTPNNPHKDGISQQQKSGRKDNTPRRKVNSNIGARRVSASIGRRTTSTESDIGSTIINGPEAVAAASALVVLPHKPNGSTVQLPVQFSRSLTSGFGKKDREHQDALDGRKRKPLKLKILGGKVITRSAAQDSKVKTRAKTNTTASVSPDVSRKGMLRNRQVLLRSKKDGNRSDNSTSAVRGNEKISKTKSKTIFPSYFNTVATAAASGNGSSTLTTSNNHVILRIPKSSGEKGGKGGAHPEILNVATGRYERFIPGQYQAGLMADSAIVSSSGSMTFNALKKRAIVKPLSSTLVNNGAIHSMPMANKKALPTFTHPRWSNGWTFDGESFEGRVYLRNDDQPVLRRCYNSMRHDGGDIIRPRDCVLLKSGPRKNDLPFVAKVAALWENPNDGEMMFSLLWYYRPEHTDIGRLKEDMPDEIFASRHRDCNSVATIEDKCYVLTYNEYCRYKKRMKQLQEGIPGNIYPPLVPLSTNSAVTTMPVSNFAVDIAAAVWSGISAAKAGDPTETCVLTPGKVSPEVVFFCRKVYDYRQKRMLKNPS